MRLRHLSIIGAIAITLAACGGTAATTTAAAAPTTTGASATTLPAGTIKVTLIDVDAQTEAMTLSSDSAPAGTVTFEVTNTGNMEHEFVVLQTETMAADLPFDQAKDEVIEDSPGLTNVDEIEGIQPGETKTLVVDLTAGHYALICNITKHWREGMRADFSAT
jgi:uncharacterized cupredoxin-like copper-binding protein